MCFVNWNKLAFALLFGLPVMILVIMMSVSSLPDDYQANMELKQRCIEAGYTKVSARTKS